jgi:aminoglycoside phosphotransferase
MMPIPAAPWAPASAPWVSHGARSSGATVYHVGEPPLFYVKTTPPRHRDDHRFNPADEAARLQWLAGHGIPVPEVVALGAGDAIEWVVTRALPGRPAARRWKPDERWRVIEVVAEAVRMIHALPVEQCPFERRLADLIHQARVSNDLGAFDGDDVDPQHLGLSAQELWDKFDALAVPPENDLVVCHGDLCLDNVLVDPGSLTLAGIIDVDRAGVADRWTDLALALYNIGHDDVWGYGPAHAEYFLERYDIAADQYKVTYFQLLDEFL